MLKRFFISMLGTMAGIWVSLLLAFLCGIMLVGVVAGRSASGNKNSKSILYLNLSGVVEEREQETDVLTAIQNLENNTPTLQQMLAALDAAADDNKIKALYLDCAGAAMGMASREELAEAIDRFKIRSGKPVIAYADNYAQGDYILASRADSVYLNPMGAVDIHGVGGITPFFRNALDKLGIRMQIIKVGTFKSAVEPFILSSMSEPARLQMQQYCDSLWAYASNEIATGRDISNDSIRTWASEIIFTLPANDFVERRLVDRLEYRNNVENILRDIAGAKREAELPLVSPAEYMSGSDILGSIENTERPHVAVLFAVGDIVDNGKEGIVGSRMAPEIIDLADNDKVRGLVLRVNSGGGSAFASEQIWHALEYFKSKGKPFYVSMGDYAASGGYYISCGADRIFADATTITGSIGVFGMIPDLSGLVTDKLGVDFSTVETNANAAGISLMEPMTPQQHAAMQRSVDQIYETFTTRVANGRDMPVDSVKAIAEGRVWVGAKALQLGLVDTLGSLADAVAAISSEVDLDSDAVQSYPAVKEEMWLQVLRQGNIAAELSTVTEAAAADPATMESIRFIRRLRSMNPMQARMEIVRFH